MKYEKWKYFIFDHVADFSAGVCAVFESSLLKDQRIFIKQKLSVDVAVNKSVQDYDIIHTLIIFSTKDIFFLGNK